MCSMYISFMHCSNIALTVPFRMTDRAYSSSYTYIGRARESLRGTVRSHVVFQTYLMHDKITAEFSLISTCIWSPSFMCAMVSLNLLHRKCTDLDIPCFLPDSESPLMTIANLYLTSTHPCMLTTLDKNNWQAHKLKYLLFVRVKRSLTQRVRCSALVLLQGANSEFSYK